MKLLQWTNGDPPTGFELGPAPTDFGVGRAAYRFRKALPTDAKVFIHPDGRVLDCTIYRGDIYLERMDGSIQHLSRWHNYTIEEIVTLMKEAAFSGLTDLR